MPTLAFVLIKVKVGKANVVLDELRKLENVQETYMVTGVYDIVAKLEAPSLEKLGKIIADKLHEIEGVTSTVTCIVVK